MEQNNHNPAPQDDLRAIWKKDLERAWAASPLRTDEHLNQRIMNIQQQSNRASSAFLLKIMLEVLFTLALMIGFMIYMKQPGKPINWLFWSLLSVVAFSGHVFYYFKMKNMQHVHENDLKTALEQQAKSAQSFLQLYDNSVKILLFILFLVGVARIWGSDFHLNTRISLSIIAVAAAFGFYGWVNVFLERYYGRHVQSFLESVAALEG